MVKKGFDYEFDLKNESDYNLVFNTSTTNKFFLNLYQKAIIRLKRKKDINVHGNINKIQKISIKEVFPPYLNLIKVYIQKHIKQVVKDVNTDGIKILNNYVDDVVFVKNFSKWDIKIYVVGTYEDLR